MKILIAENDQETAFTLNKILINNGFEVEQASSVKDAVGYLQSDPSIGLIICNTTFPGEDGFDLLRQLQKKNIHVKTPVLMCGATGDKESVLKSIKLGARDFILKPFDPDILMEKIARIESSPKIKPQIMVIDDEEFLLDVLKTILKREGYSVVTSKSAREGLEILAKTNVEVIISDIIMPEMDGMELLTEVKAKYPKIKMLMITGHSGKYGERSVLDAGADGFITKPFKNIEITRTIQRLALGR